jgi:putative ABC transport system substrate-binding protein
LPGTPSVDAVYLSADPLIHELGAEIIERINKAHLPTLAADLTMVTHKKALLGLVPDNYQVGHLAAQNALAVLDGTPPSDVPSKSLDFFMVVLNMQTARILDVQIPLSLLVIADTIVR